MQPVDADVKRGASVNFILYPGNPLPRCMSMENTCGTYPISLGYVDLTALVEYTRVAMSTTAMRIRNLHGTYPPHVAIQRPYIVCTYSIAIGGGHSALHIGQSACATSILISDIFLVHENPGIFLEQRSLGHISWTYILFLFLFLFL